jgi:endonuclease III
LKNGIVAKTPARRPAVSTAQKIPFPARKVSRAVALEEFALLEKAYPQAVTALEYESPFTLLIAVILSAQTTDVRVNLTTPFLFAAYPTPQALANAALPDVEDLIKSTGFFRMKAKSIVGAARALVEKYGGEVPSTREELEALPGVGRKTASVVMSVAFEEAAFAVDTHVFRVSHRLGLTLGKTPRDVENDVVKLVPPAKLRFAHHWLILHGRTICKAPLPLCERCPVRELCPSAPLVARFLKRKRTQAVKVRRAR